MKHFTILLSALFFVFFSCNNAADEQQKDDANSQEQVQAESEDTQSSQKQSKTIVVNEPTVIDINDVEKGAEFFGLTVTDADIQSEKEFTFTIAEEFILDGNLSDGEEGITYMVGDPTRSNAVLQIDDMEKPFFMWTKFNNNEAFMAALTDEQKQKMNTMEGTVPLKIKLKNYKVGADAEYMWIGASADFVEVIE